MRLDSLNQALSPVVPAVRAALLVPAWLIASAAPSQLAAQRKAEFTPFVAVYLPTTDLIVERNVLTTGDRLAGKQKTSILFGGRLAVWLTQRIGVEGTFGYSPSNLEGEYTDPSNVRTSADTSARVIVANARVLFGFGPTGKSASWHLIVGGGIVSHGGDGYNDVSGNTDIAGIVGLGGRFKVGSSLAVRLDVEDNFFSAKFKDSTGAESESEFQNDIVISLGLAVPFGGK